MEENRKPLGPAFFALLSLPATAMGFALSVQISALSWILMTQLKLSTTDVGRVWSAGPMAGILGQVIIGFASDRVWFWNGRRRPFILIGGALASMMLLALPNISQIATALHMTIVPVAVGVALTLDLAINVGFNPTRSIIADVTPEGEARTQGFTWMQTVSGLFGVFAYFIGASSGNYILIYVGCILVFVFTIFPPFFIKEPRELHYPAKTVSREELEEAGGSGAPAQTQVIELLKIYFAHAFTWLGVQNMFVYMVPFLKGRFADLNLSDDVIGQTNAWAFLVMSILGFLLPAFVLEPVSKKLGRVRTHALSLFIMAVGYGLLATSAHSRAILFACMAVVGVGWAATVSLPFAIFSEKVDPAKMGTHMGIFNLSVVLPQLIVSWYFGSIIESAADKSIVFYISGAALVTSSVLWLVVRESQGGRASTVSGGGHH